MSEYARALLAYLRERRRCLVEVVEHDDDGDCEKLHREMVELSSGEIPQITKTMRILEKFDDIWGDKWVSKQDINAVIARYSTTDE